MYHHEPGHYEMFKADSGAIRFKLRYPAEQGQGLLSLISKTTPKKVLYDVNIGPVFVVLTIRTGIVQRDTRSPLPGPMGTEFTEFWLTWYGCAIRLGLSGNPEPLLTYTDGGFAEYNIGYIKFYLRTPGAPVEWEFEASPVILKALKEKTFQDDLEWKTLIREERNNIIVPVLPAGAMIGGFENEPIYIARAHIMQSLCIGKYVPSKSCAYFPWGENEYLAQSCQILCGVNAKWVKTQGNYIPENALVGGYSEVRHEPLYIGRAMHEDCLLVGKVHTLYSACYLPYRGKELCVGHYEILVKPNVECRGKLVRQKKIRNQLDPAVREDRRYLIEMLRAIDERGQQRQAPPPPPPLTQQEILEILSRNRIRQDPRGMQSVRYLANAMLEAQGPIGGAAWEQLRAFARMARAARVQLQRNAQERQAQDIPYRGQLVALGFLPQRGQAVAQRAQPMPQRPLGVEQRDQVAERAEAVAQAAPQRGQARGLERAQELHRQQEAARVAQVRPQREEIQRRRGIAQDAGRDLQRHPWEQGIMHDLQMLHEIQGVVRDLRVYNTRQVQAMQQQGQAMQQQGQAMQQGQGMPQQGLGMPQQGQGMPQQGQGMPQQGQGMLQQGQGMPQQGQGMLQQGQGMPQQGQGMPQDLRIPQEGPPAPQQYLGMPQEGQRAPQGGQPGAQEALRVAPLPQPGFVVQHNIMLPPAVGVRIAMPQAAVAVQQWGGPGLPLPVGMPQGGGRVLEPPPAHGYQVEVIPPPAAHIAVPPVAPYPGRDEAYWAYVRERFRAPRPYNMLPPF